MIVYMIFLGTKVFAQYNLGMLVCYCKENASIKSIRECVCVCVCVCVCENDLDNFIIASTVGKFLLNLQRLIG